MNLPLDKIEDLLLLTNHGTTMGEIVKKILSQLESFAGEAQRKIEKYQKIK